MSIWGQIATGRVQVQNPEIRHELGVFENRKDKCDWSPVSEGEHNARYGWDSNS